MPSEAELVISARYEFIALETFEKNLRMFSPKDIEKIKKKIVEMLSIYPQRYPMLFGKIPLRGLDFVGLRHMKIGVSGLKGGAYILYRICEECKNNGYFNRSDEKCAFCDDTKDKHVILFDVRPRSFDYAK
jgi:mRNA-degrading endonuclease RelE of RelBE toxin-antitoxin system